jgi:hypothetical protein
MAGEYQEHTHRNRHYKDFIIVIEQHPKELYENNSRHPMVHSVNKALRLAKVDHKTLKSLVQRSSRRVLHKQLHGFTNRMSVSRCSLSHKN